MTIGTNDCYDFSVNEPNEDTNLSIGLLQRTHSDLGIESSFDTAYAIFREAICCFSLTFISVQVDGK